MTLSGWCSGATQQHAACPHIFQYAPDCTCDCHHEENQP